MKKFLLLISCFGIAISCTRCANVTDFSEGDETQDFNYALSQFNSDLQKLGYPTIDFSGTKIKYVNTDFARLAYCYSGTAKRKRGLVVIQINKTRLPLYEDYVQLGVIYHEIGHCFLGLKHSERPGKWLMTEGSINVKFQPGDILVEENRLKFLKDMLEASGYQ